MEPPSYEEARHHPPALSPQGFNILPPPSYDASLSSPSTPPPTYGEAGKINAHWFIFSDFFHSQSGSTENTSILIFSHLKVWTQLKMLAVRLSGANFMQIASANMYINLVLTLWKFGTGYCGDYQTESRKCGGQEIVLWWQLLCFKV